MGIMSRRRVSAAIGRRQKVAVVKNTKDQASDEQKQPEIDSEMKEKPKRGRKKSE